MLGRCPDVVPASAIGDHSYVAYLRIDDVKAFHDRAIKAGAEILKPPTDFLCRSTSSGSIYQPGNGWPSMNRWPSGDRTRFGGSWRP